MLKNYLKIAFRNLIKNKSISFINITGLAIGIACAILIVLYVQTELSYDKQHSKSDRIFRVLTIDKALGVSSNLIGITHPPLGPAIEAEFPEVEAAVRINRSGKNLIEYKQKSLYTTDLIYAEQSLFDVFDFKLISGEKNNVLSRPNTAVISGSMAEKIFGNENPVGKVFKLDNEDNIEVTGILQDVPYTSHLAMDVVISILPAQQDTNLVNYLNSWNSNIWLTTYVLLNNPDNEAAVEKNLESLVRKNNVNENYSVTLQPLQDIHLKSSGIIFDEANQNKSDISYVYSLSIVAFFIILIASFNFMNLSTARSAGRAKEVGLRKVIGAFRQQLIAQYLGESVILCFISLFIALILAEIFIPLIGIPNGSFLNYIIDKPAFIWGLISGTLILGLLSGIYPAFVLSKFTPIKVLKGSIKNSSSGIWMRRILVVVQFAASIGMIISTYIVYQQLEFIRNKNAGYNREQVMFIELNDQQLQQKAETFLNEVIAISTVEAASLSSALPGRGTTGRHRIKPEGSSDEDSWIVSIISADERFIPHMQMKLAEGRNFSEEFSSDKQQGVIINQVAVESFNWQDPIGKKILTDPNNENQLTVIGVVEDFHFASMRNSIEPLIIVNNPQYYDHNISVRLKPGEISSSIVSMERIWKQLYPNYPFEYSFLDNEFEQMYKAEKSFSRLILAFAVLAVFIACLGLFGLASFITEQRTKEIGIRKVLGASMANIMLITTKQFVILVLIANILIWPIAYYLLNGWLNDFAYRIELNLITFLIAALLSLIIAVATVLYQSIKVAIANPVKSLRYE